MKSLHVSRLLVVSLVASVLVGCGAAKPEEAPPPARIDVTTERAEISNAEVGNVQAEQVTLNGAAAQSVEAQSVTMSGAAAQVVTATQLVVDNSGLALVNAGSIQATDSGLAFVQANSVTMGEATSASFVRAQTVTMQSSSSIGFVIADRVEGDVQPTITKEGAIAMGVATGATVVALLLLINALSHQ